MWVAVAVVAVVADVAVCRDGLAWIGLLRRSRDKCCSWMDVREKEDEDEGVRGMSVERRRGDAMPDSMAAATYLALDNGLCSRCLYFT